MNLYEATLRPAPGNLNARSIFRNESSVQGKRSISDELVAVGCTAEWDLRVARGADRTCLPQCDVMSVTY